MRRAFLGAVAGAIFGAVVVLALPSPGSKPLAKHDVPRLQHVEARTLLAWTPSQLPRGFVPSARRIPGIAGAVEVRSGTAWLATWNAKAATVVSSPAGLLVPFEVAAVDPAEYAELVPPAVRPSVNRLARGGVILGRRASDLRATGPGGRLAFGGVHLDVVDVVADELIGAHEAIVSTQTGAKLGITRSRYALIALSDGASPQAVESRLRELTPSAVRLRVRAPGETPTFRHGDAVLPPVQLKELFGEFAASPLGADLRIDPEWRKANIRTARVPVLGAVQCHAKVIPQLRAAFGEIARRGLDDLIDPSDFGGCFSPRFLNRDREAGLSHHAWGVAFDLNVSENPFGRGTRMDGRIVEILERWGFTWGGRWLVPDSMHFEFVRFPLSPKS